MTTESHRKALGMEFAPLSIPLDRRMQTFAVFFYMSTALFMGMCTTALLAYLFFYTGYAWVTLLYLSWMAYDWNVGETGGRKWK